MVPFDEGRKPSDTGSFRAWSGPAVPVADDPDRSPWAKDDLGREGGGAGFPVEVGRWLVTEVLGRGGYGVVYRAKRLDDEARVCALKLLPADARSRPEAVARFFREGAAVARLDHPGIVKLLDFGCWRSRYFYTMELIEGRDLHRVVREDGVMSEAKAAGILSRVARALEALGGLGFVHRDLKPENVLVNETDAKLIDFGLVKVSDTASITTPGDIVGTPYFMAPEYISSGDAPDIRADVYALGVIFHFLLTGRYPFMADSPAKIFEKHMSETPPLPSQRNPKIGSRGDEMCRWLLEKEADMRPGPEMAALALEDLANG